jgi:hypothetical protein
MIKFFVGLDLGRSQDYTALSILERVKNDKEHVYHVRHLERIRGAPYPAIVDKTAKIMQSPGLKDCASLVVDQTGVGAPVVDLFEQAGLKPVGVLIHGGDKASHEGESWRVPKRDLVGVLQVLLQTGRLKVASRLKLGTVLSQEMLNFKVKIDPMTAHDSYSAWREEDHDDLVLSVALAAWYGENGPKPIPVVQIPLLRKKSKWMREW